GRLRAVPAAARAVGRVADHISDRARQRARCGVGTAPRGGRLPHQGPEPRAPDCAGERAVSPGGCAAQARHARRDRAPRRAHAGCRAHAGAVGRPGGAAVAHRVLDRARARATLVLPWGGCQYAREMESALREGEENSLQAVSQTIAASLQGRTDLLYREAPPPADAPEAPPDETSGHAFLQSGPYDLKPLALTAAPLLDGYSDDWPHDPSAWAYFARDDRHRFGILTGVYECMLYVLLEVRDEHPLFDAPGTNPLDPGIFGDRVWLGFEDSQGEQRQVFLAATAPGAVTARGIETGEYGQQSAPLEPRIRGAWQPMSHGYRIELRVPLSMLGNGFGVLVDDRDARGAEPVSYGTLRSDDLHTLGRLIVAAPELTAYLAQFMQPGLKLAVTTPSGRVLA